MIQLDGVGKRYPDGTVAVGDLTMSVATGELMALVGPSGSGKSTTLRMVNRLIEPTSGRIWLDGEDVTHVDPVRLRRSVGYVIQRVGLFPHLTVADNVATVPRLLGWDRGRVQGRVTELLELVGLDPAVHARRYPHELSGGQQQRVGVARALAADPPVLLMDEPFGAVDPLQRERLQGQFRRIQGELGKTVLFVTHDIDEAVRLADRVAVFGQGGTLLQLDDPATLLASPASDEVGAFVGADRGIRRMSVTPVAVEDLVQVPTVVAESGEDGEARFDGRRGSGDLTVVLDGAGRCRGWLAPDGRLRPAPPSVPLGASLREGFAALSGVDLAWVPVAEGERYVGTLTPDAVHAALRRTLPADHAAAQVRAAAT
jgi:osmoprotectant transport system ATP-binding protein